MQYLYLLALYSYVAAIRLASLFGNQKAKLWLSGRKQQAKLIPKLEIKQDIVWVHCASLGEFEQGRPVIENLKDYYPNCQILLTFFSPSGYEIRKTYEGADYIYYLPLDSPSNAKKFIQQFKPKLAIFIKYEFWYFYMKALQKESIPTLFVSSIFRENQFYFKWYGAWFRKLFKSVNHFFVQDQNSANLLQKFDIPQCSINGDTRVDRVLKIVGQAIEYPIVEAFSERFKHVIVCGSTWPADEAIILKYLHKNKEQLSDTGFIIAPHNVDSNFIQSLENTIEVPSIRYSKVNLENCKDAQVLIIDNIGMLAFLYRYGKIAYIGGGFGSGIHNTLEAAVYGIPLIFGPKHLKFKEAIQLKEMGAAFSIESSLALEALFKQLKKPKKYQKAAKASLAYIKENKGASRAILSYIREEITPT